MTSIKTPTKSLAVVSAAALLGLTACSGGTAVYDFTEPLDAPAQSIEFRVPEELIEMDREYADTRILESITVSATEHEDPSHCAVEFRFEYVDGGLERLLAHLDESAEESAPEVERMGRILTDSEPNAVELTDDYSSAVVSRGCATSPSDDETTVEIGFVYLGERGTDDYIETEVSVMQGGDLFVHNSDTGDWELDSNGGWIQ